MPVWSIGGLIFNKTNDNLGFGPGMDAVSYVASSHFEVRR